MLFTAYLALALVFGSTLMEEFMKDVLPHELVKAPSLIKRR